MGRRGPAPTPTKVLEARGSWRAKLRKDEPRPAAEDAGVPEMPDWLRKVPHAEECWTYHAAKLGAIGLTTLDRNAFARYCATWGEYQQAQEVIAELGPTVERTICDRQGNEIGTQVIDRPEVARGMKLQCLMDKLERKLGLTPSDRANMATKPTADPNAALERELFGPTGT